MKKLMLMTGVILSGVLIMSMNLPGSKGSANSVFLWDSKVHDFGKIEKSLPVEHVFSFKNEGDAPLIISSVKASCGCTVAEYTKEPIAPGARGEVLARYNAAKVGSFSKTVTVMANTKDETVLLTLKGEVVSAE